MCSVITRAGHRCKNGTDCPVHTPGTECPICLNPTFKTRSSKKLKCNHVFHVNCLNEWQETGAKTCPLCRANICPSKYRVSFKIENLSTGAEHQGLLDEMQIINLFIGMGVTEFSGNLDVHVEPNDLTHFLNDLGIRFTDIDPLVFDTE